MLWNLMTDRPSDSHPICPRRGAYLFPASDCIKFVLFLTLLEKKNELGGCAAHTGGCREPKALYLCLDGSGRSVLLGTQWAVVFGTSLHPSCPPDIHSPSLLGLCSALCICVYVCICMCLGLLVYAVCSCLRVLWTTVKICSLPWISHDRDRRQQQCLVSFFHRFLYLDFFRKDY